MRRKGRVPGHACRVHWPSGPPSDQLRWQTLTSRSKFGMHEVYIPLPSPMIPRVLAFTSTPTSRLLSHFPAFRLEHPSGIFRATASNRAMVCSAAAPILPAGLLTTMIPCFVAASTSIYLHLSALQISQRPTASPTLSTPTPALATTFNFFPAASNEAVTLVSDLTISAS